MPGPPEETPPHVAAIVAELGPALAADFASSRFPAAAGWSVIGVAPRKFMQVVAVVSLERDSDTLCFIITPTDKTQRAYRRTNRYDISYFSEDVPDDEQDRIYARDRGMIDAFVKWLVSLENRSPAR